jgi:hypothetical protein
MNFIGLTIVTYFAFIDQFSEMYYWIFVSIINLICSVLLVLGFVWSFSNSNKENNAANNALDFFIKLVESFNLSSILYYRFFYFIGFLLLFAFLWFIKLLVSPDAFAGILIATIVILFIGYLILIFYKYIYSPVGNNFISYFTAIPGITWVIIAFIIILIIILFYRYIFSDKNNSIENEIIYVFVIIGVILAISGIAYKISTNNKEGKENIDSKTWRAIGGSWKIILYTIGLILCFCLTKKDILDKYAYIITSLAVMISVYLFYNSFVKITDNKYKNNSFSTDIATERIKTIILFLCVIVISILLYSVDPGGLVYTYVGPNFIYTILLGLFGFLFMSMLLQYPKQKSKNVYEEQYLPGNRFRNQTVYNKYVVKKTTKVSNLNSKNFLDNFKKYTVVSLILFVVFIISVTVIISTYPGGFFNDRVTSSISLTVILMICILWVITLAMNLFKDSDNITTKIKNVFMLLIGFGFLITLILFLTSFLYSLNGETNIIRLVTNSIILLFYVAFFIRTIVPDIYLPYIHFSYFGVIYSAILIAIVLYMFSRILINYFKIIMIFIVFFFVVWSLLTLPYEILKIYMFALIPIILFLIYYYLPTIQGIIATKGGKLLIANPIPIDRLTNLSNYEVLNGTKESKYKFAISFWVYIEAVPPNTNVSYSTYTSIMNYGEKPNVLYNPSLNSFMITMQQRDFQETSANVISEFNADGNRILYTNNDFLLQKWNNVIINYDGGTLDVFLNGELVRSVIGVIPYITLDELTIGASNGILGNICNFVYYADPLTVAHISYIYSSMKNENPPVPKKNN